MARILVEGTKNFGVFRKVDNASVCYGGPFSGRSEAEKWKEGLERQSDFVCEEELNSRNFRLVPMKPNSDYLFWDGLLRCFDTLGKVVLSGRREG